MEDLCQIKIGDHNIPMVFWSLNFTSGMIANDFE